MATRAPAKASSAAYCFPAVRAVSTPPLAAASQVDGRTAQQKARHGQQPATHFTTRAQSQTRTLLGVAGLQWRQRPWQRRRHSEQQGERSERSADGPHRFRRTSRWATCRLAAKPRPLESTHNRPLPDADAPCPDAGERGRGPRGGAVEGADALARGGAHARPARLLLCGGCLCARRSYACSTKSGLYGCARARAWGRRPTARPGARRPTDALWRAQAPGGRLGIPWVGAERDGRGKPTCAAPVNRALSGEVSETLHG